MVRGVHILAMDLKTYLADAEIRPSAFARTIGRSHTTVLRWIEKATVPSGPAIGEVFRATGGKVTASDFFHEISGS